MKWRWRRDRLDAVRRSAAAEIEDELAFHLQRTTEELMAAGMPALEAERAAARRFGPLSAHRERLLQLEVAREFQHRRRLPMEVLKAAFRSVVRGAGRSPAFTFGIIGLLTLGLGVNAIVGRLLRCSWRPWGSIASWPSTSKAGAGSLGCGRRSAPRRAALCG